SKRDWSSDVCSSDLPVGQVVHLIHHHEPEPLQRVRAGIHHVAQHLGGHHHHRGLTVDGGVTGEQPHLVGAVASDQVVVLLVAQQIGRASCREGGEEA